MNDRNRRIAWLQLLRLPNIFTAVADVMMGFLVTHGALQPVLHFFLLTAASCALYLSGMVLNDVFDADVDAQDRPERPIPSGQVPHCSAAACGLGLLASGILIAWFTSFIARDWRPGLVATLLAVCIVLYDWTLKRTRFAALLMGACRMLNVLLGMSLAGIAPLTASDGPFTSVTSNLIQWNTLAAWLIALGIGVYIVGVTWFARTEARASARPQLIGGLVVMLVGMAMLITVPSWTEQTPPLRVSSTGWYLLWAALALIIARRCLLAIFDPTPPRVQAAVRNSVQSIIVLDAAVCVGYAGPIWGLAVLVLLFPTLALTLWIRAT